MRSAEINEDLLNILNKTDARKSLAGLRRAAALSRGNVTRLRSNHVFSVEQLTQNLEDVARGGLKVENSLSSLKSINKQDVRIRFLTELVVMLDVEKRELAKRLNKALAEYNEVENSLSDSTNVLTKRRTLAPLTNSGTATNKVLGRSSFSEIELDPSISVKSAPFSPPLTVNPSKSRSRSYIQRGGSGAPNRPGSATGSGGLPQGFLRQSLALDRDSFRQNREFLQQQTRFQADSQRKIEGKLDKIADLLKGLKGSSGGGSGGFDLPDIDLGGRGRGRAGRPGRGGGRLGRIGGGAAGLLKGGIGAIIADQFLNKDNTSGTGAGIGGAIGSLTGNPLLGAFGAYLGNDIEESMNPKGREAQKNRIQDKIQSQQSQQNDAEKAGIKGRWKNLRDFLSGKTNAGDFFSGSSIAAIAAQEEAKRKFKEAQNNTSPIYVPSVPGARINPQLTLNPGDELHGLKSEKTDVEVKPEATLIINAERLYMNGGGISGGTGSALNSTDTTFGGMGMGPGGIGGGGSGSGSGPGSVIGSNTPPLIPNVKPGLGQTPSQAQADAQRQLEQSKMPQYNPQMSPNAAAGGGPQVMPEGLGGETPKGVTDLPFLPGSGAAGSSALKNNKGTTISTFDTDMAPHKRALLDTISRYESNGEGQGYNTTVGGGTFEGNQHPGNFGGASTAAGRYQFLKGTWNDTVKNYNKANPNDPITDFSPRNQDRAAYYLAQQDYKRRTGRDLDGDLQNGDYSRIREGLGGSGLNTTWQGFQGKEGIPRVMEENLEKNKQYAENSTIKNLDPNAVPNAGIGSTPRAGMGDILGSATPGDPSKSMFGTIDPSAKPSSGNYDPKDPRQFKTTDVIGADHPIWGMVNPKLAAYKDSILGKTGSGAPTNNITAGALLGADAVFRRAESEGVDMKVATGGGSNQHSRNHGAGTGVGEAIDIKPSAGWSSPDQAKSYAETAAAAGANRLGVPANGSGLHVQDSKGTGSGMPTMSWNYGRDTDMQFRKDLIDGKFNTPERKAEIDKYYPARTDPNAKTEAPKGPTMPEGPSISGTIAGEPKVDPTTTPMVNTPSDNSKNNDDYSRAETGKRNFGFGSDGFLGQGLGTNGFSGVNPTGAFGLTNAMSADQISSDAAKSSQASVERNLDGTYGANKSPTPEGAITASSIPEILDAYDQQEKIAKAKQDYIKEGMLKPGEGFGEWLNRRETMGFNDRLNGLAETDIQRKPDGGFNAQSKNEQLNDDFRGANTPGSFMNEYAQKLDSGDLISRNFNGGKERYFGKGSGARGIDNPYYAPNPLTIPELKALYGPNASTDGVSPSVNPNAVSQGSMEGSTRQSVAPPIKETYNDNSSSGGDKSDSKTSSDSNKEAPSGASATPVGGGDQEELKGIPVKHDDMGLSVLNDKDLAV